MEIITDRINLFVKHLNISKNEFGKSIGVSSSLISQITTKKNNFRADIIQKISSAYPQLNIYWLLSGNGEMLNINHNNKPQLSPQQSQELDSNRSEERNELNPNTDQQKILGMTYTGYYDENKIDYYFRHPEKQINKLLIGATGDLKDTYNDYITLIGVSIKLGAPDFILEKFNAPKSFKTYKNDVDEDMKEDYIDIDDKSYLKCIKITRYESEIEHFKNMISQLIHYMDRYSDFFTNTAK